MLAFLPPSAVRALRAATRPALPPLAAGFHTSLAAPASPKRGAASFVCSDCGHDTPKWAGRCPACGAWDTIKEFRPAAESAAAAGGGPRNVSPATFRAAATSAAAAAGVGPRAGALRSWLLPAAAAAGGAAAVGGATATDADAAARLTPLSRIASSATRARVSLGSAELDRLLGGGLVPGSVTLLGGAPGAGKSTLLLQVCALLARGRYVPDGGSGDGDSAAGGGGGSDGVPYADFFCGRWRGGGSRRARRRGAPAGDSPPSTAAATAPAEPPPALVAYVSGEESASQLRGRAQRLGIDAPGLLVLNETRVDAVIAQLQEVVAATGGGAWAAPSTGTAAAPTPRLAAVVIDSIQTVFSEGLPGAAGSVSQVRDCALRLTQWAKATGVPVVLVGHVTKAGDLAGPRVLEHLVDTVLFMEGDVGGSSSSGGGDGGGSYDGGYGASTSPAALGASSGARLVRSIKNRFGSTSEVGIFSLSDAGFTETNPARLFLSSASAASAGSDADGSDADEGGGAGAAAAAAAPDPPPGCAVTVTVEGSRPLCVEVQALASARYAAWPRHRSQGLSADRLFMLAAVLSRHTPVRPRAHDVDLLVNVVGGLRLSDPASDLAVALAVASSLSGRALPRDVVALGEVGLAGEVRPAAAGGGGVAMTQRLRAAAALGFRRAIVPVGTRLPRAAGGGGGDGAAAAAASAAPGARPLEQEQHQPLKLVPVRSLAEAVERVFGPAAAWSPRVARRDGGGAVGAAAAGAAAARAGRAGAADWLLREEVPPGEGALL